MALGRFFFIKIKIQSKLTTPPPLFPQIPKLPPPPNLTPPTPPRVPFPVLLLPAVFFNFPVFFNIFRNFPPNNPRTIGIEPPPRKNRLGRVGKEGVPETSREIPSGQEPGGKGNV